MSEVVVMLVTAPGTRAPDLARALVEEGLAACVNIVPGVRSVYRWEGTVEEAEEVLLVIKTRSSRATALEVRVRELHPYDVPEVLALPVVAGSDPYLDWVRRNSQPQEDA